MFSIEHSNLTETFRLTMTGTYTSPPCPPDNTHPLSARDLASFGQPTVGVFSVTLSQNSLFTQLTDIEQTLLQAKGYSIASFICYEVVYPEFAASLAARSNILLTVSNDAWFGSSIGPLQHLQMAQMRALEAGRWMIRATNNGVTALIDPQGQITTQLPQFEQAVLYGQVQPMQGLTPYLQWRGWPMLIICLGLFAWALMASRMAKTL